MHDLDVMRYAHLVSEHQYLACERGVRLVEEFHRDKANHASAWRGRTIAKPRRLPALAATPARGDLVPGCLRNGEQNGLEVVLQRREFVGDLVRQAAPRATLVDQHVVEIGATHVAVHPAARKTVRNARKPYRQLLGPYLFRQAGNPLQGFGG